MAMIDTQDWEFFDFPKVFRMENGFYNKKPESSGEGTIPFIGATDKNNGVTDYFTIEEIESASKTGEAAAIAEPPQIAVPIPTKAVKIFGAFKR